MNYTNGIETPLEQNQNREIKHAEDILGNYDMLTPEALLDLAHQDTDEAREQMQEIAEHYDIPVEDDFDPEEVAQKIIVLLDKSDAPNQYNGTE